MRKLLLVQPTPYDHDGRPIKKRRLHFVGLTLPLLAALTPPDWQVEICLETIEKVRGIKGVSGIHIMAIEWEQMVPEIVRSAGLYPRPQP